ncbi:hypothetical protein [Afipia sp. GAS231]|nr:hypothetical protein [Afipia sp. GAS231]SDN65993.1 hypothetical protein SAMN05444050_2100 [Afipia sp. GAS231]
MKHGPVIDHTLIEQPPSESERSRGILTTGVIALVAIGIAIYWMT